MELPTIHSQKEDGRRVELLGAMLTAEHSAQIGSQFGCSKKTGGSIQSQIKFIWDAREESWEEEKK